MKSPEWLCEDFSDLNDSDIEFDLSSVSAEPYLDYDNRHISCSFTGHRAVSDEEKVRLLPVLKSSVLYLYSLGVREFHCGGAMGFDTLCATVVYDIARTHKGIRLILELPFEDQTKGWKEENRRYYDFIKTKADEINIHSENPKSKDQAVKALLLRNRILIDKSHYCICFLKSRKGGTAYTVNYAGKRDVQIINLADNNQI